MMLALIAVLSVGAVPGHGAEVPHDLALAVMLKVLTYDVNFKARGDGEFVVLVPHVSGHAEQAKELVSLASGLTLRAINARSLKFVAVAASELGAAKGSAVLLPPGSSAELARTALSASLEKKLYLMAFEEALVREGAMIGVSSNDGKPQVVLNMQTSRQLGVELGSAVLRVARTYH